MVLVEDDSSVHIVSCPFGTEVYALGECHKGVFVLLLHEIDDTECRPVGRVLGIVFDGLGEAVECTERIFLTHTYHTFLKEK